MKVLIYYPTRGDGHVRKPGEASYSRVPCVGEIVEAPAPLAPERSSLWEVTRVVHLRMPRDGVVATISVESEQESIVERISARVVEQLNETKRASRKRSLRRGGVR
jgi:hypothetical protein